MPPAARLRTVNRVEGDPLLLPGTLAELTAAHPEVVACCVDGVWHGTVHLDAGCDEGHGDSEGELLAKLTAALGG